MAINTTRAEQLLKQHRVTSQLPIDELIIELNKLFHMFEARTYDATHPEIHEQLPSLWQEMIRVAMQEHGSTEWRILDFGCGSGFEAEHLIRGVPKGTITQLTCYDPSPEMLEHCQRRISPLFSNALYLSDYEQLQAKGDSYNLLATNAVLHHVTDPIEAINRLLPLLTPDCVWLAGHEPSTRFYKNEECLSAYERFSRERKWRRYLSLHNYLRRASKIIGLQSDPYRQTAKEAYRKGLLDKEPPISLVDRLVDLHVAHSEAEAHLGRGFDFQQMQGDLAGLWELTWVKTYSYMGDVYEGRLSKKWARICHDLADRYPQDGASFCSVWRRATAR